MRILFIIIILLTCIVAQAKDEQCVLYNKNSVSITLVQSEKNIILINNNDYRITVEYPATIDDNITYEICGSISKNGIAMNRTLISSLGAIMALNPILENDKVIYYYGVITLNNHVTYIGLFVRNTIVKGIRISHDGSRNFVTNLEIK